MNTFYNFTLKVELKRSLNPSWKLEMSIKKIKNMQCKIKNNFKCSKFTIKKLKHFRQNPRLSTM